MPFFTSFSGKILSAPGLKLGPKIFEFIKTFTSNVQEYNLRTDLLANGWNGVTPVAATLTVNAGVYIWSDSTSTAAFNTGTLVSDSIISIINNGYIIGRGGDGARGDAVASAGSGGHAISLNYPVSITNNSYIAGGGGGGGGHWLQTYTIGAGGGGGAGGGSGGLSTNYTGGAGGAVGSTGANGLPASNQANNNAGGGGGGRILPGTGGSSQGAVVPGPAAGGINLGGLGGGSGGSGGAAAGGPVGAQKTAVSGAGGSSNSNGSNASVAGSGTAGGGGGGWGASGGTSAGGGGGTNIYNAPGSGGKAVNLNGNTVTWIATGTRYGAIS